MKVIILLLSDLAQKVFKVENVNSLMGCMGNSVCWHPTLDFGSGYDPSTVGLGPHQAPHSGEVCLGLSFSFSLSLCPFPCSCSLSNKYFFKKFMLNERNQTQKAICCIIPFVRNVQSRKSTETEGRPVIEGGGE